MSTETGNNNKKDIGSAHSLCGKRSPHSISTPPGGGYQDIDVDEIKIQLVLHLHCSRHS
jgi:hypothetical protein